MSACKHCKGTGIQNVRARGTIGGWRKAACRSCSVPRQAAPKREHVPTLNSRLSDADLCRANGWRRGTRLRGTEHYSSGKSSTCTITITAVGDRAIIARCAEHGDYEGLWTLHNRDWQPVKRVMNERGAP